VAAKKLLEAEMAAGPRAMEERLVRERDAGGSESFVLVRLATTTSYYY
jgi:hypothetical protein